MALNFAAKIETIFELLQKQLLFFQLL